MIALSQTSAYEPSGSWDSIHVFETVERGRQAHYKLTSTVMLHLITRKGSDSEVKTPTNSAKKDGNVKRDGEVNLSGSMTRQASSHSYRTCLWH